MSSMFDNIARAARAIHDTFTATWDVITTLPAPMLIGAALIITGTAAIAAHNHR